MMENEDKFFGAIEDTLHSYEDVYPAGAWEEFSKERKRRRGIVLFLKLGSAAAVLLFLSYFTIQFFNKEKVTTPLAQIKPTSRQQKNNVTEPTPPVTNNDSLITSTQIINKDSNKQTNGQAISIEKHIAATHQNKITPAKEVTDAQLIQPRVIVEKSQAVIANVVTPDKTADITNNKPTNADTVKSVNSVTTSNVIAQTDVKKYAGPTKSVYDSIVNSKAPVKVAATTAKKAGRNLSYGVVVSPALGNQKVNLGTGVEVAYKISKNFFVSSGIAYSSLNATGGRDKLYAAASGAAASGSDVSLQVSGFEVPLGLQYRTDNGFYVSAGVVAMGVTNNKLQYSYVAPTTAAVMAPDAAGFTQNTLQVVNEKKTEDSKEKLNNYLGFYMMSIGKKKKIGNNQFTFGPFMRVPFGAVSSQKISLFQGGVKLGFEF